MADAPHPRPRRQAKALPLPDQVALVLQGGGALGSYQAGVIDGLADSGIEIDWVAGISIGAINAAIVAGNPPSARVERLRAFWDKVTSTLPSRSEEHTSELQSLMRISYAVFCLTKKKTDTYRRICLRHEKSATNHDN